MDSKEAALAAVNARMNALGLRYAYDRFHGTPAYPYFVGSYREISRAPQQARVDGLMTITGFDKAEGIGRLLDAEAAIKANLNNRAVRTGSLTVALDLAGSYELPMDDARTKRVIIQISTRVYGE